MEQTRQSRTALSLEEIEDPAIQEIRSREAISPSAEEQDLPATAQKWSWGAFWLTFIWGLKHKFKVPWLFLFPVLAPLPQLAVGIYCGIKGNRWAWQNLEWESEEQFASIQRKWSLWGFLLGWLLWVIVIFLSISIMSVCIIGT